MSVEELKAAAEKMLRLHYCSLAPTEAQAKFLFHFGREAFFGGAAGGGKSVALLMAFDQFTDIAGYAGLIVRNRRVDLDQPGGLLDIARRQFGAVAEFDSSTYTFRFPSAASLRFGYLDSDGDIWQYLGSEYQYIAFDELTQIDEDHYEELFSRLRKPSEGPLSGVPLRVRSASNPGGPGHQWVKRRFVDPGSADAAFFPAKLLDNPHLDHDQYVKSLSRLNPVRKAQLLEGDWTVQADGRIFQRDWFNIIDAAPEDVRMVRAWDLAGTPATAGRDPDYTVGALVARTRDGNYHIVDIVRFRASPAKVRERVRRVAEADGNNVRILIEEEPGSAGKALVDEYKRQILDGYAVYSVAPTGSKELRADPLAAKADAGYLHLIKGEWNAAFLDEIVTFPDGRHDDQVDAAAHAYAHLAERDRDELAGGFPVGIPRKSPWKFDHPDGPKRRYTQTIVTFPDDWDW